MSKDTREWVRALSRITLLTQLGLSLVVPPVLLVLGALWLQEKDAVGDWILLCAILAGILSGGCSVYNLLRAELRRDARGGGDKNQSGPVTREKEETDAN